jgi:polyisoprenoid-binding protein YceI
MTRAHIAAVALLALIGTASGAQETARIPVSSDSKLWIEGTSNLHAWTCKAEKLDAAIDLEAAAASQLSVAPPKALKRVQVTVPVRSLKCGHDAMDKIMYKSLAADASPTISYVLTTFDAAADDTAKTFTLHAMGTLTVAGKQNALAMDVVATRSPDGSIKATGTVPLKMTDYGIKPPTALLGTLKTGNDVKIKFELTVGAKAIATAFNQP